MTAKLGIAAACSLAPQTKNNNSFLLPFFAQSEKQ